jgi:hypothetical protein
MVRPYFDENEGLALTLLDALATGRPPSHTLPRNLEPSEELIRIGCHRLNIHLCRHLLHAGGHRERTVLREGRRVTGRLWDGGVDRTFRLRFTEASLRLWLDHRVRVEGTECGDWLFYERAQASGFDPKTEAMLGRRLRSASPLVVLASLEPHIAERAAIRNQLARLLQTRSVRMIECLDDPLLAGWLDAVRAAAQHSVGLAPLTLRFEAMAEVLDAWVDVLDEKRRLDLTAALMRLMAALDLSLESLARHPARNVHERQAAQQAMARLVAVGVRLETLRDRFAALRYGDERWDEGQLYLALFDGLLAPHRDRLRGIERELRGVIG